MNFCISTMSFTFQRIRVKTLFVLITIIRLQIISMSQKRWNWYVANTIDRIKTLSKYLKCDVTSMSEIWALSYQREFIWRLARFKAWRSQSTSDISISHVHICSLDQIFTFLLLLLLVKHALWHYIWSSSWRAM